VDALNLALQETSFSRDSQVNSSPATSEFRSSSLRHQLPVRLNRMILEDTYPLDIASDADSVLLSESQLLDIDGFVCEAGRSAFPRLLARFLGLFPAALQETVADPWGSPLLTLTDLKDTLVEELTHPPSSSQVSSFLWSGFSSNTRSILQSSTRTILEKKKALLPELNKYLVEGGPIAH